MDVTTQCQPSRLTHILFLTSLVIMSCLSGVTFFEIMGKDDGLLLNSRKYSMPPSLQAFETDSEIEMQTVSEQDRRQQTQRQVCSSFGFDNKTHSFEKIVGNTRYLQQFYVSERYRILFCLIPKAGSENWVRAIMILEGIINATDVRSASEIVRLSKRHLPTLNSYSADKRLAMLQDYTSLIFVRNPYPRLLSAFRDRLETYPNRNLYHRRRHNKKIYMMFGNHSQMPHPATPSEKYNVTFKAFIDYYLNGFKDIHWREQSRVCPPCFPYDYIGKIESYVEDFNQIISIFDSSARVPIVQAPHATNSSGNAILRRYYDTLSDKQMRKLEKELSTDMKVFGYSIPEAIKRN